MARERIKVTRPDATGFDEVIRPVRDRSDFTTLKMDSIEAFEKKRKQSSQNQDPAVATDSAADKTETDAGTGQVQKFALGSASDSELETRPSQTENSSSSVKGAKTDNIAAASVETDELVELRLPPRRRPDGFINLSLRLRVLARHVEALRKLEDKGVDLREVFRAAYRSIPPVNFIPRYVPQVAEPSGPGKYSYRIGPPVLQTTITTIEGQVRGGANASRASLLLGQIEPVWFEKLDITIREYMK